MANDCHTSLVIEGDRKSLDYILGRLEGDTIDFDRIELQDYEYLNDSALKIDAVSAWAEPREFIKWCETEFNTSVHWCAIEPFNNYFNKFDPEDKYFEDEWDRWEPSDDPGK